MPQQSELALLGGDPIFSGSWPRWPRAGDDTLRAVAAVLKSGRWAVSGPSVEAATVDVQFAAAFAEYTGARRRVPVDHGSSALLAALTAVGIGPGDEVIVPGYTWVACASAILRCGAVPILVDIDASTLCMDPAAVRAAITPKTAAVLVVHMFSVMADMDALCEIATKHGLAIIEDAAHVPGACWRGHGAGSLGLVGVFSMQQTKVLTSGEGGVAVTSDGEIHNRLEQLRGDGRKYAPQAPHIARGYSDLEEVGDLQGWNMHLSEMQAAVLLASLSRLPAQNRLRAERAKHLERLLSSIEGVELVRAHPENDIRTYYYFVTLIRSECFADRPAQIVCDALSREIGARVHAPYAALDECALYNPTAHPLARLPGYSEKLDPKRFCLDTAHKQSRRTVGIHHSLLLGSMRHMEVVAEAFEKVRRLAHLLPSLPDSR